VPAVGDTFRGDGAGTHLYVVITSPATDSGRFVIVNLTTKRDRRGEDLTCVLHSGDHPFVWHDSIVLYIEAYITDEAAFRGVASSGQIVFDEPMAAATLNKIQQGALVSRYTANKIKALVRSELGVA
jgi:hypothetical protein